MTDLSNNVPFSQHILQVHFPYLGKVNILKILHVTTTASKEKNRLHKQNAVLETNQ